MRRKILRLYNEMRVLNYKYSYNHRYVSGKRFSQQVARLD